MSRSLPPQPKHDCRQPIRHGALVEMCQHIPFGRSASKHTTALPSRLHMSPRTRAFPGQWDRFTEFDAAPQIAKPKRQRSVPVGTNMAAATASRSLKASISPRVAWVVAFIAAPLHVHPRHGRAGNAARANGVNSTTRLRARCSE